jgi:hypothetical protein
MPPLVRLPGPNRPFERYLNNTTNPEIRDVFVNQAQDVRSVLLNQFDGKGNLALVGLAACLAEYGELNELPCDGGFLLELKDNLEVRHIECAVKHLETEDRKLFMIDLEKVKSLLSW